MSYVGEHAAMFEEADEIIRKEQERKYGKDFDKRDPIILPMPRITNDTSIEGPMRVTDEFIAKYDREKAANKEAIRRNLERHMCELLGIKLNIISRLPTLDPTKRKDSRRIAALNFKLREVESDIEKLREETGLDIDSLNTGSKVLRFITNIKKKLKKMGKKIRKFWRRHGEVVVGLAITIIPAIILTITKRSQADSIGNSISTLLNTAASIIV